jgi:hypothetical protein
VIAASQNQVSPEYPQSRTSKRRATGSSVAAAAEYTTME